MAQTDRLTGLASGSAIKVPCKAATTANITLSGEQTIDGVSCVTGDRVLVKNQTDATETGIYIVDSGAWSRAKDWNGVYDVRKGTLVFVHSGSTNQGWWYVSTSDPITVGTTEVTVAQASTPLAVVSAFAQTILDDTSLAEFFQTIGVSTFAQDVIGATDSTGFIAAIANSTNFKRAIDADNIDAIRSTRQAIGYTSGLGIGTTLTQLALLDLGSLSTGDEIMVQANLHTIVRSSNGGRMSYQIALSSGTGAIFFGTTQNSQLLDAGHHTSDTTGHRALFGIATVMTAGPVAIDLSALSAGSTSSVDRVMFSAHVFPASTV